jgi:hypothetical protein
VAAPLDTSPFAADRLGVDGTVDHIHITGTAAAPACDLSTTCLACGEAMRPEHAHYRCPVCGWRDSCCDGPH